MKRWIHRLLSLRKLARSLRFKDTFRDIPPCDVIVCCADSDRTEDYEGKAYSRILDSLAQELERCGLRVQRLAWPKACVVGSRAWGHAYCANRRFFRAHLWSAGRQALGLGPTAEQADIRFYADLLASTGAAGILGIGLPPAVIKAARSRGAKSVEVLHGYGYASLPWGWDAAPPECLPDTVIAFDDMSAKTFGALSAKGVHVSKLRNFWYEKFRADPPASELPPSWRQDLQWIPQGKKIVLVSTSWGYDGDHGPYVFFKDILKNGLFPEQLLEAIEMAGDHYHWLFRLHPVQLSGERSARYRDILQEVCRRAPNCSWQEASRVPLPLLLRQCHAHISMISMTAYDAAFMGLQSLMLCPTLRPGGANEPMFSDLKEQGYVQLGSFSASDMVSWLSKARLAEVGFAADVRSASPDLRSVVLPSEVEKQ